MNYLSLLSQESFKSRFLRLTAEGPLSKVRASLESGFSLTLKRLVFFFLDVGIEAVWLLS